MEALLGSGGVQNADGSQALMHAPEAERLIEGLVPLSVQDVGTPRWTAQDQSIQRLNLQAHHNAQQHAEEFVVELLVSLDKMQVLVQNLLAIEAWKEKVLPHLHRHLARNVDKVVSYMVLYHEVNLANLLEVTLYHSHAAETLSEEHLLELADWCYRKLTYLNAPQGGRRVAAFKELSAQQLLDMSPEQELDAKVDETEFGAAMCSLSILRYLTDGLTTLPLGLLSRVVATNDTLMALVPLLDQPPWVRRRPNGVFEKWINSQWQAVKAVDRFRLTLADAQVWLAITNLVVEPKSRAKYGFDEWRRDRLLILKRFMNELLFDQMPVLKDLQRVLDEMALGVGSDAHTARNAALILEAVPVLRDSLLAVGNWRELALAQARDQFGPEATRKTARVMYESLTQAFDFMADLEGLGLGSLTDPSKSSQGGGAPDHAKDNASSKSFGPGPVRMSSWRKVHESGVMEAWSDYVFELDPSKPPEPVTLEHLQGLRYRLLPMDLEASRPLPISGKAVVRCNENPREGAALRAPSQDPMPAPATLLAEALVNLPEVALRSKAGEQPPVVWVTIGLLATDGLALQLKLKRADKPRERDKVLGVWCAYHPVGGALTVVRNQGSTKPLISPTDSSSSTKQAGSPATGAVGPGSAPAQNQTSSSATNAAVPPPGLGKDAAKQTSSSSTTDAAKQTSSSPTTSAVGEAEKQEGEAQSAGSEHHQQSTQGSETFRGDWAKNGEDGSTANGSLSGIDQQRGVGGGHEAAAGVGLCGDDEGGEEDALDLPD